MRRKQNTLVPLEQSIIDMATHLQQQGIQEFHGFRIAKEIEALDNKHHLIGFGTLYRALNRLQKMGRLQGRWEDEVPQEEHRPRRRYYHLVN